MPSTIGGMKFGILHPGAMGVSVAAAAAQNVDEVAYASQGRSAATLERASAAGLRDVKTLDALVERSDLILSVCPPASALELAESVAKLGFSGIYVDANAVSPETARRIATVFTARCDFVDGGIIGPPAHAMGTTRLHLSGARAAEVAKHFDVGPLDAFVVDGPVGAASALKMVFAAWTKGSAALLAATHAVAVAEGVEAELIGEWEKSAPGTPQRLVGTAAGVAPKAWRFEGEMHEIADTFRAAGIPPGFFEAAAEVYARLASFKDADPPTPDEVAAQLRESGSF